MSKEKEFKKEYRKISRRQFLKDAGIVVGGTTVGSAFFLTACGKEVEVVKTVTTSATKYVCPVDDLEFDSLDALKAHYDAKHDSVTATQSNMIKLTVNGNEHDLNVQPSWTLWQVLREKLGYLSPKEMCVGWGGCGSCTVIKNGRPILSCMTLAVECDGDKIETAEGIVRDNHPLLKAYVDNNTMQCGYCTPGFFVTAKALLDRNPNPTKEEIMEALAGNICRCGTYPMHTIAVSETAEIL